MRWSQTMVGTVVVVRLVLVIGFNGVEKVVGMASARGRT